MNISFKNSAHIHSHVGRHCIFSFVHFFPFHRRKKRIRGEDYTPSEDKKILDHLLKGDNATKVGGVTLWKRMAAKKVVGKYF